MRTSVLLIAIGVSMLLIRGDDGIPLRVLSLLLLVVAIREYFRRDLRRAFDRIFKRALQTRSGRFVIRTAWWLAPPALALAGLWGGAQLLGGEQR